MNTRIPEIELVRTKSLRGQIIDDLRRQILDGVLSDGERLPPARELAKRWGTDQATVHYALAPLVKEGLLVRAPRVGTFVRQREQRLTRVGIYMSGEVWRQPAYAFGRALCNELHQQLGRDNIDESIWTDPRPWDEQHEPWADLARAVSERRIQALIVPTSDLAHIAWLDELPVPVAFLCSKPIPNRVQLDPRQWADTALQLLANQGCRRVGVISALRLPLENPGEPVSESTTFYRELNLAAERLGLELRPEWVVRAQGSFTNSAIELPQFGFESMLSLWRQAERPDGIAVYEDVAASGALMAIMREQIRVPHDVKLVLHRNAEVGLFCPMPAAFVEVRISEIASGLIAQVKRIFDGDDAAAIHVPYYAVPAP